MVKIAEEKIIGIIPAAGKGSRLYPYPCPKELFPIGYQEIEVQGVIQKRPKVISQYLVENITKAGASRLYIILGEDKHEIMRYYGDGTRFGVHISYLFQEHLYGMPYAINLAAPWLIEETVLFGMPDTIIEPKDAFSQLLKHHKSAKADLTLGLFHTDYPSKFGMVEIDDSENIIDIVDKPTYTNLEFMWGCGCWSPKFTVFLSEFLNDKPLSRKEVVLGDIFKQALLEGLVVKACKFMGGNYIDIGTVDELDSALKKFHL